MTKQLNLFRFTFLLLVGGMLLFSSCNDDDENEVKPEPSISEVEIGSGNNKIGVIGRDFHFNADILAGDKIDSVTIKIQQRADEAYASTWGFEVSWSQHRGAKNATLHEHFDIPEDAVEGKYDFLVIVADENGTRLEEAYEVELVDPANLPVDPKLYIWMITTDQGDFHYVNETLENPDNVEFSKGEVLTSDATIQNVKGDGKIYLLLIKKSLNHLPETVADIDFSKVIVYDAFAHENEEDVFSFGNVIYDGSGGYLRSAPEFTIGASVDNNLQQSNPIDGVKGWETGDYYFGVVYTNFSHDISLHHFFELSVEGF